MYLVYFEHKSQVLKEVIKTIDISILETLTKQLKCPLQQSDLALNFNFEQRPYRQIEEASVRRMRECECCTVSVTKLCFVETNSLIFQIDERM